MAHAQVFFASVSLKVASNMGWERLTDFLQREWRGSPSPSLTSKQAEPEPPCRSPTQAIEQVRRSLSECDLALSNDLMELLWKVFGGLQHVPLLPCRSACGLYLRVRHMYCCVPSAASCVKCRQRAQLSHEG